MSVYLQYRHSGEACMCIVGSRAIAAIACSCLSVMDQGKQKRRDAALSTSVECQKPTFDIWCLMSDHHAVDDLHVFFHPPRSVF